MFAGSINNGFCWSPLRSAATFVTPQENDGSFGFPARSVITGNKVTTLRGRIYNDDETLVRDVRVPCACLTSTPVLNIDGVYNLPPANVSPATVTG